MARIYHDFEEIEGDLRQNAPQVVYKYRSWKEPNHKNLLLNQEAWFSHPFDLNDPLDVRPETVFDAAEIDDPRYLDKLIELAPEGTDIERQLLGRQKWAEIKANPGLVLVNQKNRNAERKNFDTYGVFSTAMNELNENNWIEYGDQHAGYCLGFKTIEFCRGVKSAYGYVQYSDEPYEYHFLDKKNDGLDILYLKKTKWEYENEFRFITMGIGYYCGRLQKIDLDVISEIVLGYAIPQASENEIIDFVKSKQPLIIPVFKTARDNAGRLTKVQVL